eukprot:scaffold141_cov123-Isochrysis_galbana.AAC.15
MVPFRNRPFAPSLLSRIGPLAVSQTSRKIYPPPSLKHHLAWASADRATAIISTAPRLRFQLVHP